MDKLHKKMVALGDLKDHSYESIVSAVGEPKERKSVTFSDIGEGSRATWSDGVFTITLNFDPEGKYCGIYHHRNWEPYIWLVAVTAVLVAAIFIWAGQMKKAGAGAQPDPVDAAALAQVITANEAVWRTDATAGASVIDLDFDGVPELVAVDTEFVYDETLEADYFGATALRFYRVTQSGVAPAGGLVSVGGYCFAAQLVPVADYDPSGAVVWFYQDADDVTQAMTLAGDVPASTPVADAGAYTPGEPQLLMCNECWLSANGEPASQETVAADITAMCEAWSGEAAA